MEAQEDDDIKLQRASSSYIVELQKLLQRCLWKQSRDNASHKFVHRSIRQTDVERIIALIDPFQEDPQLLDSHLKHIVPQLVDAYLLFLQQNSVSQASSQSVQLSSAIGLILDVLCKVRGEKVIVGFFKNEPRHVEAILSQLERCSKDDKQLSGGLETYAWQERYVLLLWLSHLMLAPFDLATISSGTKILENPSLGDLNLPPGLSDVPSRILPLCLKYLRSATKEKHAASKLLVRLILRPDMRKIGLLHSVVRWSLTFLRSASPDVSSIHVYIGILTFISQFLSSGAIEEIHDLIPAIYNSCQRVLNSSQFSDVLASAVARKLVIKSFRTIVVHGVQNEALLPSMDISKVLEDVIDHLLQALADRDTPVRYAASKALSAITLKLDPSMAEEVIDAVIGSLGEDVLWSGTERNLSSVNPLRWHGLTLTLAHLLYRKAPPASQLAEILNALLLALNFEQRSTTGSSIGTNVRDAACFGIWALSRRYATNDLLRVQTTDIKAANTEKHGEISILQFLAIELVVTSCLDPAGNIRRGASAALQELVGRHPDTVAHGIALVQVVDFHAVGLRDRAFCSVAIQAASLHDLYWEGIFDNILKWRGLGSVDALSRESSSSAIALLSSSKDMTTVAQMFQQIQGQLERLSKRDVEGRHGALLALSALIDQCLAQHQGEKPTHHDAKRQRQPIEDLSLLDPWNVLTAIGLQERDFTATIVRPELTAYAVCSYISSMAKLSITIHGWVPNAGLDIAGVRTYLGWCLRRDEKDILDVIPMTVKNVLLADLESLSDVISAWLKGLVQGSTYAGSKSAGYTLALGSAYGILASHGQETTREGLAAQIIEVLAWRCTAQVNIEARATALRSLQLLFTDVASCSSDEALAKIQEALDTALNDYTINERGDVGSIVRLEALNAFEAAWGCKLLSLSQSRPSLYASVIRLSLEKLDKVRMRAAQVLTVIHSDSVETTTILSNEGISSYAYFQNSLRQLRSDIPEILENAVIEGYVSAMGTASESVVQASRLALIDTLELLPTTSETSYSLQQFGESLTRALEQHLTDDRVLLPLMESLAFLFDMQVLYRLVSSSFKWRTLLSLVQKAHFKSTHMHKLLLALELYRGLAAVESVRPLVLSKVKSMLLHPFPKVRIAAAETLYGITHDASLEIHDWSQAPPKLKEIVQKIQEN